MLVVDRLVGDMAIIEYEQGTFQLPRCLLPADLEEGDVLRLTVQIDAETTTARRDRMERLLANLWESENTPE